MTIQAVFFDIDGTFYDHKTNRVLPQTIDAVKQLKENGYKVALCSGRSIDMAKELNVLELAEFDGFIGAGGICVYDENYQMIHENRFTKQQLQQIFRAGKQHDLMMFVIGEELFTTKALSEKHQKIFHKYHLQIPEAVHDWTDEKVEVISIFEGGNFKGEMFSCIEGVRVQPSCDDIVDILKDGVDKSLGISQMMEYWGIKEASYMAFGDSLNDAQMLQHAEIGVAMKNSMEDLFPYADEICGSSDTPAIAETLRKHGLI